MCSIVIYRNNKAQAVWYVARTHKSAEFIIKTTFGKRGALKYGEYLRIVPFADTPTLPFLWDDGRRYDKYICSDVPAWRGRDPFDWTTNDVLVH